MGVSALDLRILRFVLENGLLESEREIARKLRISPSTFSFKMRKFEDSGIITAYRYRADFCRLGFAQMAWIRLRPKYGKTTMDEHMKVILEHPQVHVCVFTSGSKNFAIKAYGKNKADIEGLISKIASELNVNPREIEVFYIKTQYKSHNQQMQGQSAATPDETDIRILAEKMQNPNESLLEVAKKLKLHRNTATFRWNAMVKNNIIIKKTPIINPALHREIGIHCMAMHIFTPKGGKKHKLVNILSEMNEVHELSETDKGLIFAIIRTNDLGTYFSLTSKFLTDKKIAGNIGKSLFNIIIASDSRKPTYLKDLKC